MVIAVYDIGGSHISHGYCDFVSSCLLEESEGVSRSLETNEANSLTVLIELAKRAKALYGRSLGGLSIAVPNPFDHRRGMSLMQHKLRALYGVDLRSLLSDVTQVPERYIVFVNDADAFLLGALFASNISTGRSVGITLGTGVGSAFAEGTEILLDGDGVPAEGEIWNLPYGLGTVEDTISTRRLEGEYTRRTGTNRSVKLIAEAARAGELEAKEVMRDFGQQLAEVMERTFTEFDPTRIMLGGGISSAGELFLPQVLANRWCADRVSIVRQRDVAPLLGAAVSWRVRKLAECINAGELRRQSFPANIKSSSAVPSSRN
jgi:glucokinase